MTSERSMTLERSETSERSMTPAHPLTAERSQPGQRLTAKRSSAADRSLTASGDIGGRQAFTAGRTVPAPAPREIAQNLYHDDVQALEDMIRGADPTRTRRAEAPRPATLRGGDSNRRSSPDVDLGRESRGSDKRRHERAADRTSLPAPARAAGFRKPNAPGEPGHAQWEDRFDGPLSPAAKRSKPASYDTAYPVVPPEDVDRPLDFAGPELDLPDDGDDRWGEPGYKRRHRSGPSWPRIFVSVAGAIVTGAIFGYIVLALFTGEPLLPSGGDADPSSSAQTAGTTVASPSPGKPTASQTAQASAGVQAGAGTEGAGHSSPASGTVGDAKVTASVSYLLQYGVFQSEASMRDAVKELESQGIAAASDTSDGYRVYAGIATTKADADKLAATLTDAELYAKALDNAALSLPQTPAAVSWADYLEESDSLGRLLAGQSAALLAQGGTKPLGEKAAGDVQAALLRWNASATDMAKWSGSRSEPAAALAAQLKTASEQMDGYASSPSPAKLRAVQTAAMKAALIAHGLRAELGEDGD